MLLVDSVDSMILYHLVLILISNIFCYALKKTSLLVVRVSKTRLLEVRALKSPKIRRPLKRRRVRAAMSHVMYCSHL